MSHKPECCFHEDGLACSCGQITQEEWDGGLMVRGSGPTVELHGEQRPIGGKTSDPAA